MNATLRAVVRTALSRGVMVHGIAEAEKGSAVGAFIGMQGSQITISRLENMPEMVDLEHMRPQVQWWLDLRPIAQLLSQPVEPMPNSPAAAIFPQA